MPKNLETLEMVKRSSMFLLPKQPFIDWVNATYPDDKPIVLEGYEGDVFLLPDFEEVKQMESWLKRNFDYIFTEQLDQWYTDEEGWPQNRTLKMFKEWFEYRMNTMVWDTLYEPIGKI